MFYPDYSSLSQIGLKYRKIEIYSNGKSFNTVQILFQFLFCCFICGKFQKFEELSEIVAYLNSSNFEREKIKNTRFSCFYNLIKCSGTVQFSQSDLS